MRRLVCHATLTTLVLVTMLTTAVQRSSAQESVSEPAGDTVIAELPLDALTAPASRRLGRLRPDRGLFKFFAIGERNQPAPTGWYPFVIARGDDREILEATPIELRPYRPLHFYGNAIRRQTYGSR